MPYISILALPFGPKNEAFLTGSNSGRDAFKVSKSLWNTKTKQNKTKKQKKRSKFSPLIRWHFVIGLQ